VITHEFVVAANRLPVRADAEGQWHLSPGGLVSALSAVMADHDAVWIGWDGSMDDETEGAPPSRQGDMALRPIALTNKEFTDYYEGFANGTLWPLYHNGLLSTRFKRSWWSAYVSVNRRFAEEIIAAASPNGTVWIHDYHLQLVPAIVRKQRPDLRIGLFLHTPFPPSQLLMRLPWREEILEGLLAADLIGFQTPTDARNFLALAHRSDRAPETLFEDNTATIELDGRRMKVGSFPISIDVDRINQIANTPETTAAAANFRASLGDPAHLLLGVDRLDYTKGINARLKAFLELLREGTLEPESVAFVQVATPSRDDVRGYENTRAEIEQLVGEINGDYARLGRPVVHYLHQNLPFEELIPLYMAADVMVVTPFEDGMNLVAKEYVASRIDGSGVLVLSEFAGTAVELHDALLCNPFDIAGLKRLLLQAISMPPGEQSRRMDIMRLQVSNNTVYDWAKRFLDQLDTEPDLQSTTDGSARA
jgi:trehalose 6-phosphate synthase